MYMGAMCRLKPAVLEEEEEALGVIWHQRELGKSGEAQIRAVLAEGVSPGVFDRLMEKSLVGLAGGNVEFRGQGGCIAEDVTRRHRLAERLLTDIMDLGAERIDETACQWEHILSPEATRAICTLLGHPRHCPHGTPIPAGECCKTSVAQTEPIIASLDRLLPGDSGRIVYLALEEKSVLQKLLALGLTPGSAVVLRQREPSVVVQCGETIIALEKDLAGHISVRRNQTG